MKIMDQATQVEEVAAGRDAEVVIITTVSVSDLGFHFWGAFCPSQQFSRGHSSFLGDTLFFASEK